MKEPFTLADERSAYNIVLQAVRDNLDKTTDQICDVAVGRIEQFLGKENAVVFLSPKTMSDIKNRIGTWQRSIKAGAM